MIYLFMSAMCFGLIWIIYQIQSSSEDNRRNTRRNKAIEAKQYLAKKGEVKFFTFCKNDDYYGIVDNNLWACRNGRVCRIKISDMMATEVKYHVIERNKMKVMTVVPTFDKQTRLSKFELIIYERNSSDIKLVFTPQIVDEQRIKKMQMLLNEMIEEGKVNGKSE